MRISERTAALLLNCYLGPEVETKTAVEEKKMWTKSVKFQWDKINVFDSDTDAAAASAATGASAAASDADAAQAVV